MVAIAKCVLKKCTPRSIEYQRFKNWLTHVRDKPDSSFPLSRETHGKRDVFAKDLFANVLQERLDSDYVWLGTAEQEQEYVEKMLQDFAAWKDLQAK